MAINCKQLKEGIIIPTLRDIGLYSESAVNLLLGTAAVESDFGTYLYQVNGPAKSIFMIEENTYDYLDDKYQEKFCLYFHNNTFDRLVDDLRYAVFVCRMKYLDIKESLPPANDIEALGNYWKKYYNTELGKGKVSDFVEKYHKYVTC